MTSRDEPTIMVQLEVKCVTCRKWMRDCQAPWQGTCGLDGKVRLASDMRGCLGHKAAGLQELKDRGVETAL